MTTKIIPIAAGFALVAALVTAGVIAHIANDGDRGLAARQDTALAVCEHAERQAAQEATDRGTETAPDFTWTDKTTGETGAPRYGRIAGFCQLDEDGTRNIGRQAAESRR